MYRYFTPNTNNENINELLSYCIENELTPISLNKELGVCKLPLDYEGLPTCLIGVPEYTHAEIREIVTGVEWQKEI